MCTDERCRHPYTCACPEQCAPGWCPHCFVEGHESDECPERESELLRIHLVIEEEKHNTFERGSRFHVALSQLIQEVTAGRLGKLAPQTPGEERGGRGLEGAILSEFPGFRENDEVNGADLVEFVSEWLEPRR